MGVVVALAVPFVAGVGAGVGDGVVVVVVVLDPGIVRNRTSRKSVVQCPSGRSVDGRHILVLCIRNRCPWRRPADKSCTPTTEYVVLLVCVVGDAVGAVVVSWIVLWVAVVVGAEVR